MAIFNETAAAEAIRTTFAPGVDEAVFRNNELFGIELNGQRMFQEIANPGDSYYRWKINKSGNTNTETYSEGDAAPTAVAQGYTNAYLAWTYIWATVEITGHAMDSLASRWFDGAEMEMSLTMQDMTDLATTTILTDSTVGLPAAVSSTTTYAGITRGSAAYFEASDDNTNGALEVADLRDLHEVVRGTDKGGVPSAWLVPHNQMTNIGALAGNDGDTANTTIRHSGSPFDPRNIGFTPTLQYVMGLPVVPISDMTTTEAYLIDARPGNWQLVKRRELTVDPLGKAGDTNKFLLTVALAAPCIRPRFQGKEFGITA